MEWTRGHTIGRGSTAVVYIAQFRRSTQLFAVKSAELHRSEFLRREERILSTLNCPHIVAYQGCDITFENGVHWLNMFMEYAPQGTLAERGGCMEEAVVGSYTRQILHGLNYLHSRGMVHCDVKGQNVLVTDQGLKIADLGCARRVGESSVIAGTPAFMAPEVARGEQQGFAADVWALGCTVLEMITGKPPWHGVGDPVAVVYRIGFSGNVPEIPNFVSEQGRDFLGKCLKRDPNERWSVDELLGHGFVKECTELKLLLNSNTPTGVLERGFWDSMETTQQVARECSSPTDRIRILFSDEPLWAWDGDDNYEEWVTVRSNEIHNIQLEGEGLSLHKTNTTFYDDENGLITFFEPKVVVETLVQLSRRYAVSYDCYVRSRNYDCRNGESSFPVCLCLMIVPHGNFDSDNIGMFFMHCFLLSLSLSFFNSSVDELVTLHFHYTIIIPDNVYTT